MHNSDMMELLQLVRQITSSLTNLKRVASNKALFLHYYNGMSDYGHPDDHGRPTSEMIKPTFERNDYLHCIQDFLDGSRVMDARTFIDRDPAKLMRGEYGLESMAIFFTSEKVGLAGKNPQNKFDLVMELISRIPMDSAPKGYGKKPLETLVENNGDQFDIAMLGVGLLTKLGVRSGVLDFEGYAAIGLAVSSQIASKNKSHVVNISGNNYMVIGLPQNSGGNSVSEGFVYEGMLGGLSTADKNLSDMAVKLDDRKLTSAVLMNKDYETITLANGDAKIYNGTLNPERYLLDYVFNMSPNPLNSDLLRKNVKQPDIEEAKDASFIKKLMIIGSYTKELWNANSASESPEPTKFFYKVPLKNYMNACAIERTSSAKMFNTGRHMEIIDPEDQTISAIVGHIFNRYYPNIPIKDIPELDRAQLILDFVHCIPYINDPQMDYAKHPDETLSEMCGDCEDLAILAASMMSNSQVDLDAAIIHLEGHAVAGVYIPKEQYERMKSTRAAEKDGKKYMVMETTGTKWPSDPVTWKVGEITEKYTQGKKVHNVLQINS